MADFTVTTIADTIDPNDGALSLREVLALVDADAATADMVTFDGSLQGGRIMLAGGQLTVGSDVTIDGGSGVTIDAHQGSRVLLVQSGTADQSSDVVLQHLTVTGGRTTGDDGGGIHAGDYTTLMLDNVTVSGNSTAGMYADGGGIYGYSVTLTDSTVSVNSSGESDGGGIGGSDVTLANSTVSGNSARSGGGIYGYSVTLTDSTVSGNAAVRYGGGISGNYMTLSNSIVAGNGDSGPAPDVFGSITASNGHNIFGSDVEESISGDLKNIPAALLFAGGLADNGGPTQTFALRDAADNPALAGADPATAPTTDQRGEVRPQPDGTPPDVGAFELGQTAPEPLPPLNLVDGTTGGELLRGSAGADLIRGRPGDDLLWGFAGDDEMIGGYGDDGLVGGPGIDRMSGGAGSDRFIFRQPETAPPDGPRYDEILDFRRAEHDQIDLQPIDARTGLAGDQAFVFIGRQAFAEAGQLHYRATADGDFLVSGSVDRDLQAEFAFIVHSGAETLEAGDFLL